VVSICLGSRTEGAKCTKPVALCQDSDGPKSGNARPRKEDQDARAQSRRSMPHLFLTILPFPQTDAARMRSDKLFANHSANANGEAPHYEQDGLHSKADFLVAVVILMPLELLGCYI
jgi:hypothetical protein